MPDSPIARPGADVVVPFAGSAGALRALLERLGGLRLRGDDTLTVVDNRPGPAAALADDRVVRAPERQSSYFARNRGAARGRAPWLVFIDADVEIEPGLLDSYFEPAPEPRTAVLAGAVVPTHAPGLVARYGLLRRHVGNEHVSKPGLEYAQTANAAVRREPFEAVGGFADTLRSGGDADLSFRLRDRGWDLEQRPGAIVRHPPRATLAAMLRQYVRYGSGIEWLRRRYPGFAAPTPFPRVAYWLAAAAVKAPLLALRGRRDDALLRALDPMIVLALELGRFVPNDVGATRATAARHVRRVLGDRRALAG